MTTNHKTTVKHNVPQKEQDKRKRLKALQPYSLKDLKPYSLTSKKEQWQQ
jgi:hypothetical protein